MDKRLHIHWGLLSLCLLLFPSASSFAQEVELPQDDYHWRRYDQHWPLANPETQIATWPDGSVKTSYEHIRDSIWQKSCFRIDGQLYYSIEIFRRWSLDTSYTENLATGEMTRSVDSGFIDVWHGKFSEYEDLKDYAYKDSMMLMRGQFRDDVMVGEWVRLNRQSDVKLVVTLKDGVSNGPYFEFYRDARESGRTIKWEGQYGLKPQPGKRWNRDINRLEPATVYRSERVGEWRYYSREGELLQTVTYDWKF